MSDKKKDLTRIEDLSEFLHEDAEGDEFFELSDDQDQTSEANPIEDDSPPQEFSLTDEDSPDLSSFDDTSSDIQTPNFESNLDDQVETNNDESFEAFNSNENFELSSEDQEFESFQENEEPTNFDEDTDPEIETVTLNESPDQNIYESQNEYESELQEEQEQKQEQDQQEDELFDSSSDLNSSEIEITDDQEINQPGTELLNKIHQTPGNNEESSQTEINTENDNTSVQDYAVTDPKSREGHLFFNEIQSTAETITYGNLELGNGPPFSVLIKILPEYLKGNTGNESVNELKNNVLNMLKDLDLVSEENLKQYANSFQHHHLLISQINEYSAIILVHKLKNFPLHLEMGLSNEILEPKTYSPSENTGISANQNNESNFVYKSFKEFDHNQIHLTTMSDIPNAKKLEFLGPIQTMRVIQEDELGNIPELEAEINLKDLKKGQEHFQSILDDLKKLAIDRGGNSVINIKYQLNPTDNPNSEFAQNLYHLYCYGDLVRVEA